jgi:hypothetical protein
MPARPPSPSNSLPEELPENLTERVLTRVADARLALDQRERSGDPTPRRRRRAQGSTSSIAEKSAEEVQEDRSLKRVFRDMGISYRRYRSQTGTPVPPGLRNAAIKFRAEPSLASLVAVAAYLDELDLLS